MVSSLCEPNSNYADIKLQLESVKKILKPKAM
jgi:hypothetical protein